MSLIEFIHNLVHFCVGHVALLQLASVVDGLQNNNNTRTRRDVNITAGQFNKKREKRLVKLVSL